MVADGDIIQMGPAFPRSCQQTLTQEVLVDSGGTAMSFMPDTVTPP